MTVKYRGGFIARRWIPKLVRLTLTARCDVARKTQPSQTVTTNTRTINSPKLHTSLETLQIYVPPDSPAMKKHLLINSYSYD